MSSSFKHFGTRNFCSNKLKSLLDPITQILKSKTKWYILKHLTIETFLPLKFQTLKHVIAGGRSHMLTGRQASLTWTTMVLEAWQSLMPSSIKSEDRSDTCPDASETPKRLIGLSDLTWTTLVVAVVESMTGNRKSNTMTWYSWNLVRVSITLPKQGFAQVTSSKTLGFTRHPSGWCWAVLYLKTTKFQ